MPRVDWLAPAGLGRAGDTARGRPEPDLAGGVAAGELGADRQRRQCRLTALERADEPLSLPGCGAAVRSPGALSASQRYGRWAGGLAFSATGVPLGLLQVQHGIRDPAAFGQKHRRKPRPIEEKESAKWLRRFRCVAEVQRRTPRARRVSGGDREADVSALFHAALADPSGPGLLIRAEQDRLLNEGQATRGSHLTQQSGAGVQEIQVPRRARLEVRFGASPCDRRKGESRSDR